MNENEPIEQPDVSEKSKAQKDIPKYKPEDFGYKKFEAGNSVKAEGRAKLLADYDSKIEMQKIEDELASLDSVGKKILKPKDLRSLDQSVILKDEDRKSPPKKMQMKERQAFTDIYKALQGNERLAINTEDKEHIFDFKGLTKDGKDVKTHEAQKMLEHIDNGGDIPPNVEFHFHTTFKKDRDESEVVDIDYRVNIHQIMREGLETTLGSLLSLSYAAASVYDAGKGKNSPVPGKIEINKLSESPNKNALQDIKKQLSKNNTPVSIIQTGQWEALQVSLPEKQKQISVIYDGDIFKAKVKHPDKSVETPIQNPSEVIKFIEKESK